MSQHPHPQLTQKAISALSNSHTDIHRALQAIKEGRIQEGKNLAASAIRKAATALSIL